MADEDPIESAREEVSAHAEMFRERFLSAELAFWAALMSLAGIFVSAASVVVAVGDKKAFGWLLGAAVVATFSMALLILNFRARRSLYRFLGQPPPEEVWGSMDAFVRYVEHARKKKRDTVAEQQRCEWRERAVYLCLLVSGILLVVGSYRSGAHF
jgi:amino acid transporter